MASMTDILNAGEIPSIPTSPLVIPINTAPISYDRFGNPIQASPSADTLAPSATVQMVPINITALRQMVVNIRTSAGLIRKYSTIIRIGRTPPAGYLTGIDTAVNAINAELARLRI